MTVITNDKLTGLLNDINTIDDVVESTGNTTTSKLGTTVRTLKGFNADGDSAISSFNSSANSALGQFELDADIAIANAGYQIVGDFSDVTKAEITSENQVYTSKFATDLEQFVWRYTGSLPYTPTESTPVGGEWKAVAIGELQTIARSLNVADTAVIYSTDTTTVLDDVLYIYDSPAQTTWGVPSGVGAGEVIVSVSSTGVLTTDVAAYNLSVVTQYTYVSLSDIDSLTSYRLGVKYTTQNMEWVVSTVVTSESLGGGLYLKAICDHVDVRDFGATTGNSDTAITRAVAYINSDTDISEIRFYEHEVSTAQSITRGGIHIKQCGKKKITQTGTTYNWLRVYPPSLQGILDGTGRDVNFPSGIDGSYEAVMYEPDESLRLRKVEVSGFDYDSATSGRFIDVFSCDDVKINNNNVINGQNAVSVWYCRSININTNTLTNYVANTYFGIFCFKSWGVIWNNNLSNYSNCVDGKGCYPQAGKGRYESFDEDYDYHHPLYMYGNTCENWTLAALTSGYRDNSDDDISTVTTTGIKKREWYGKTSGVVITGNTLRLTEEKGIDTHGVISNVNSLNHNIYNNNFIKCGYLSLGSESCKLRENKFKGGIQTSTPTIDLSGHSVGGQTWLTRGAIVSDNDVYGGQSGQAHIRLRGAIACTVKDNKSYNHPMGTSPFRVDSSRSNSTLSTMNTVSGNQTYGISKDFVPAFYVEPNADFSQAKTLTFTASDNSLTASEGLGEYLTFSTIHGCLLHVSGTVNNNNVYVISSYDEVTDKLTLSGTVIDEAAVSGALLIRSTNKLVNNEGFGGWYSGNRLDTDGFNPVQLYKNALVECETQATVVSQGYNATANNIGDGGQVLALSGYSDEIANNGVSSNSWRSPMIFGEYFMWITSDVVYINSTRPTTSTDGTALN